MGIRHRWRDPRVIIMTLCTLAAIGLSLFGRSAFAQSGPLVSGSVFGDTDGDGTWDTDEIGMNGVPMWIIGPAGSISFLTDETGVFSVDVAALGGGPFGVLVGDLVDSNGAVSSPGNASGVALPAGYGFSNVGGSNLANWLAPVNTGQSVTFGLSPCGACGGVSIGDLVWFDANNNGLQDIGEPPIGGAQIELRYGGSVVASTATDASGRWLVTDGTVANGGVVVPQLASFGSVEVSVSITAEVAALFGVSGPDSGVELRATEPDRGFDQVDSDGSDAGAFVSSFSIDTTRPSTDADIGFVIAQAAVIEPSVTDPKTSVPVEPITEGAPGHPIDQLPVDDSVVPSVESTGPVATLAPVESELGAEAVGATDAPAVPSAEDGTGGIADSSSDATAVGSLPQLVAKGAAVRHAPVETSVSTTSPTTTSASDVETRNTHSLVDQNADTAVAEPVPLYSDGTRSGSETRVLSAHAVNSAAGRSESGDDDTTIAVGEGDLPILAELHDRTPVRFGGNVISGSLPRTGSNIVMMVSFAIMLVGLGAVFILGSDESGNAGAVPAHAVSGGANGALSVMGRLRRRSRP